MPPNPMEDEEDEEESEPESSDNEEIQSQPNGRINATSQPVTVASAPYQGQQQQQHYHHQALTLALPIQNSSRVPAATSGGREDCWSEGATAMLIDAWGERYLELSRGNLKQKHWKDVADIVSSRDDYTKPPKTDVQCKNRIDTVKKKYKIEKSKIAAGGGPSKWVFFNKLDRLIGGGPPRKLIPPNAPTPATPAIAIPPSKAIVTVPAQHQQQRAPQPGSSNSGGPDSSDSFPPVAINGKRRRAERESARARARASNSVRDLTRAVLEFGEVFERVERSKLQQVMEMEQQRMVFAKELELQRMQFFMKTQLELAQMKHGRTGIGNNSNNTG